MDDKTVSKVLLDVQKEYAKSNKIKDKIIMLLIVLMFAEAVVGYSGFVYYESQFETTTTEKIEVGTAELKTYVLEDNQNKMQEQQAQQNNMYVLRTDFENVIKSMKQRIEELGGGVLDEPVGNDV